jgi:hypothetical protein
MRKRVTATILMTLFVVASVIAWRDTTTAVVRSVDVPVSGLTRDVTVLHVSDLHGARFGPAQAEIDEALAGRSFDAIVLNGDLVPHFGADPTPAFELLALLREHSPVVFVTRGNHDTAEVIDAMVAEGAVFLAPGDDAIAFAPDAGDVFAAPTFMPRNVPDQASAVLFAGHFPLTEEAMVAQAAPPETTSIFLFGHTHGGQVRLPLLGAIWAPGPKDAPGYASARQARENYFPELRGRTISGLTHRGGIYAHISAGLGTQALRLRLLCPAEMTVLTLTSET